jgi:hypothetical protein
MHQPPRIQVTFYTKPGCHLCEDVADDLEALQARWPLTITAVDITRDIDLHRQYWDKIPVVRIGADVLTAPITLAALTAAVRRNRRLSAT